jgi:Cof subfamily protein (haloacid dehalogenase superfamily)
VIAGERRTDRRLIALDVDGTLLHEDGAMSERVRGAVRRVVTAGHEVMLATGRSVASTLPVLETLGILPEYTVCSNGAVILKRDDNAPYGYRREVVETFDPAPVLTTIRDTLPLAQYAVEDGQGYFRYTERFPAAAAGQASELVTFDRLLATPATRIVVISPNHDQDDFLGLVERMGLHRVSYAVGWTAWLDIAPDGVNKGTAMERVRQWLGVSRDRVVAVGDGRNDIELLQWAGERGAGVAMGQAVPEVIAAASQVAPPVHRDGLADVLAAIL